MPFPCFNKWRNLFVELTVYNASNPYLPQTVQRAWCCFCRSTKNFATLIQCQCNAHAGNGLKLLLPHSTGSSGVRLLVPKPPSLSCPNYYNLLQYLSTTLKWKLFLIVAAVTWLHYVYGVCVYLCSRND